MNFKELYERVLETEVLNEGSHGDEKIVVKAIKDAIRAGLIKPYPKETKAGWMLQSLVDDSQHLTHRGERGYHDLRRYIQGLEKISKMAH